MDWLDVLLEKLKERFAMGSLRNAMITYIVTGILCVFTMTLVTMMLCSNWEKLIENRYEDTSKGGSVVFENPVFNMEVIRSTDDGMSKGDRLLSNILRIIEYSSLIVYSIIAIISISYLFYRNRLKEPLSILRVEAWHISNSELNFECRYDLKDEMGEVCKAFDQMRITLIENNQKMWNMMEEQRRLNAAFAHDIRTPLTVLHGYADFLRKYYPTGRVSEDQMLENLDLMNAQVLRLINFTNSMKDVNSLEELEIKKVSVEAELLKKRVRDFTNIMDEMNDIHIMCSCELAGGQKWKMDEMIFMEVLENMISNGLRYAKSLIEITLEASEDGNHIMLYVRDDGAGFSSEGLKMAARPYYSDQKGKDDGTHYGIGLFICKFLCEKHGGFLDLTNSIEGGAIICAAFLVK